MGAAMAPKEVKISLYELAREELEKFSGDRERAAGNLRLRLKNDPDLLDHVVEQIINIAVGRVVNDVVVKNRREIVEPFRPGKPDVGPYTVAEPVQPAPTPIVQLHNARMVQASARNAVDRLMDFPLMNNMVLGSATKEIVLEQSARFMLPIRSHIASASFLKLVGQAMVEGKTVRQQFDENDLREFRKNAETKASGIVAVASKALSEVI